MDSSIKTRELSYKIKVHSFTVNGDTRKEQDKLLST